MRLGSSDIDRVGLDDKGGHAGVRARLVLLAGIPDHGLARIDLLAAALAAHDPPGAADDHEQLLRSRRMASHLPAGGDLDHHAMRLRRQPPDPCREALEPIDLALAGERDALQSRSTTAAIAWPKPMHMQATP